MSNLLCEKHPHLKEEWDFEANETIGLYWYSIKCGSNKKAHWICPKQTECGCVHKYEQVISSKTRGRGCPFCYAYGNAKKFCYHESLEYLYPEIAKDWHPTKNGTLTPKNITPCSNKNIWWLCSVSCKYGCVHEWQANPNNRTQKDSGCPYCDGRHIFCYHQSLLYLYPEVAKQWHPTKNENLKPKDVTPGSEKKIWWICHNSCSYGCLHEYEMVISSKVLQEQGCPYCDGRHKFCYHQSVEYLYPELVKQYHPTKNENLTLKDVTPGSEKKIWWICHNSCSYGCIHEYEMAIFSKVLQEQGCPYCSGKYKFCYHQSLEYLYPELVKQWHPTKNGSLMPKDVTSGSDKKVWWICPSSCNYGCLHEYTQVIKYKSGRKDSCPYCDGRHKFCYHQTLEHLLPKIAKEWHPTKNDALTPKDVTPGSGKKVWWQCSKKNWHDYCARITDRTIHNSGCPHCVNKTEDKLFERIQPLVPSLQRQFRADWCRSSDTGRHLPFDFLVPELKAIIELDGLQHFQQVANWDTPERVRANDQYKMRCAYKAGYSVIRLRQEDVYYDTYDWSGTIMDTLEEIRTDPAPSVYPLSLEEDDSYDWLTGTQRDKESDDEDCSSNSV